jgi:hypothetical protein
MLKLHNDYSDSSYDKDKVKALSSFRPQRFQDFRSKQRKAAATDPFT